MAYIAGMYDADGLIRLQLGNRQIHLCQACYPYMIALQRFLYNVLKIESTLLVKRRTEAFHHQMCLLCIGTKESRKTFLDRIAIYGMSRRIQWLALYIATICDLASLPDRFVVIAFLADLMRFIKYWFEES